MAIRPPYICACNHTIPAGEKCPCQKKAARARKARHDRRRPSARQRGYTSEWQEAARAFLARPENRFCECGAPAVLVRHIVSIRRRPDLRLEPSNWKPGCQRCNADDAARERQHD